MVQGDRKDESDSNNLTADFRRLGYSKAHDAQHKALREINRRLTQIYADKDSDISPQRRRGRRELPFLFVGRQRQTKTHLRFDLLAARCDSLSSIFYLHFF